MCRMLVSSLIETLFELKILVRITAALLVLFSSTSLSSNSFESNAKPLFFSLLAQFHCHH